MKNAHLLLFFSAFSVWTCMLILAATNLPFESDTLRITSKASSGKVVSDLYLLFGINLAIIIGTCYLSFFPEKLNYPYQLTAQNSQMAFKRMKMLLAVICLSTTFILMFVAFQAVTLFEINNATILITALLSLTVGLPIIMALLLREKTTS